MSCTVQIIDILYLLIELYKKRHINHVKGDTQLLSKNYENPRLECGRRHFAEAKYLDFEGEGGQNFDYEEKYVLLPIASLVVLLTGTSV